MFRLSLGLVFCSRFNISPVWCGLSANPFHLFSLLLFLHPWKREKWILKLFAGRKTVCLLVSVRTLYHFTAVQQHGCVYVGVDPVVQMSLMPCRRHCIGKSPIPTCTVVSLFLSSTWGGLQDGLVRRGNKPMKNKGKKRWTENEFGRGEVGGPVMS